MEPVMHSTPFHRGIRLALLTLLACIVALPLVGCRTSPINGAALLPASQADLDAIKADTDADRENTAKAIEAVRTDLTAANVPTPETNKAVVVLDEKRDEVAERPVSTGIPGALINALGGALPGWLDWLITLLTGGVATAGAVKVASNRRLKRAIAEYDAAPYVDPATGSIATEGALVRAAMASPTSRIASGLPPPASPTV